MVSAHWESAPLTRGATDTGVPLVYDFDGWAGEVLARGAVDELIDFRNRAPGMPYAHPTVEHFAPLFVTLGTATDPEAPPLQPIEGFWLGLSKRSLQVA